MPGPPPMGLVCLSRLHTSSMAQPRARTHDPEIRTGGEVRCRMFNQQSQPGAPEQHCYILCLCDIVWNRKVLCPALSCFSNTDLLSRVICGGGWMLWVFLFLFLISATMILIWMTLKLRVASGTADTFTRWGFHPTSPGQPPRAWYGSVHKSCAPLVQAHYLFSVMLLRRESRPSFPSWVLIIGTQQGYWAL